MPSSAQTETPLDKTVIFIEVEDAVAPSYKSRARKPAIFALNGANSGGREWESNPHRTIGWPTPGLKSGRPTGSDSLP